MTQIRNVYILFEKGLEPLEPHIKEALEDVMSCFPEHRMDYPLIVLGDWQTESYMRINDKGETVLRPYESVEYGDLAGILQRVPDHLDQPIPFRLFLRRVIHSDPPSAAVEKRRGFFAHTCGLYWIHCSIPGPKSP